MKNQIIVALALLISSMSFAQKNELKAAEKAIKKGNFADAKTAIQSAESLISAADDKTKAKFYYLKGQSLYANGAATGDDMTAAIESLNKVSEIEKKSGKAKYSAKVVDLKQGMLASVIKKAEADYEAKKYIVSSTGFEKAYRISSKDTMYLYFAATAAVQGKDFDKSLTYYEELNDMGYQGKVTKYFAVNKETGKEEPFNNKQLFDASVKTGSHIKPREEYEFRSAEVIEKIALIYMNKGEDEKAIAAMKEARAQNPDDLNLLLNEANLYHKLGNTAEFKRLIEEALIKDPNNPELIFNLGIMAAEEGDTEKAKSYYSKVIAIDPEHPTVYNNMAALIFKEADKLSDEMLALGNSAADNKKYDELEKQRIGIFKEAIPFLETSLKLMPDNIPTAQSLMSLYSAIGETEKFKAMKTRVKEMENRN